MKEIHIGEIITQKRKEKGITQEQLANFLNVSAPAVSKWESGKCYPDLTFLPLLSSFFQISIDELLGYQPFLSKEEIHEIYQTLCKDFTEKPFETVIESIEQYVKKYCACYELQFQMGVLLINHLEISPNRTESLEMARQIFQRVVAESRDVYIQKQAIHLKATCHMMAGDPQACIETLEPIYEPLIAPDPILAKSYAMCGDLKTAQIIAQGYMFQTACAMIDTGKLLTTLYTGDLDKIQAWEKMILQIGDALDFCTVHPAFMFQLYLSMAVVFAQEGEFTKALLYLEKSLDISYTKEGFQPVRMQKSICFDELPQAFSRLNVSIDAPRDEMFIKESMKSLLKSEGMFGALKDEVRFQKILQKLERI